VHRYSFVNVVAAAGPSNRAAMTTVADPADPADPAEPDPPRLEVADPEVGSVEVIEVLVASGLSEVSPAGASGQNERRMDS
jgi:hypothetical protein